MTIDAEVTTTIEAKKGKFHIGYLRKDLEEWSWEIPEIKPLVQALSIEAAELACLEVFRLGDIGARLEDGKAGFCFDSLEGILEMWLPIEHVIDKALLDDDDRRAFAAALRKAADDLENFEGEE